MKKKQCPRPSVFCLEAPKIGGGKDAKCSGKCVRCVETHEINHKGKCVLKSCRKPKHCMIPETGIRCGKHEHGKNGDEVVPPPESDNEDDDL